MNAIRRRAILATGGFCHLIHDGFTNCVYVLLPLWAEAFGLNHAQVGLLRMFLSGALAALQIPMGFLAERIGERAVLAAGTVLTGAAFASLGLAGGFAGLALCLVAAGAGCSTQHPLASAIVSKAYAAGRRRAALGTYNFAGDIGKVVMPASVAAVAAAYGWRGSTLAIGVVGIVAGVAVYLMMRRLAAGGPPVRGPKKEAVGAMPVKGWGIHDRRGFAALSAISIIDTGSRLAFLTFVPFLLIGKGAAVEQVGFALTLIFAGGAAGKLVCGLAAERVGILRTVIVTEIATSGLMLVLVAVPLIPALVLLPFLGVALNGTSSVLYGSVGDYVDADRQARAFGLFYTLGISAGALAPAAFGMIVDASGIEVTLSIIAFMVLLVLPLCWFLIPKVTPSVIRDS